MTATITRNNETVELPMTRDDVKQMLRDAAYVLHLTRRVKEEIIAERPESARGSSRPRRQELAATGLGV